MLGKKGADPQAGSAFEDPALPQRLQASITVDHLSHVATGLLWSAALAQNLRCGTPLMRSPSRPASCSQVFRWIVT